MWCALIHNTSPESPEAWWERFALPLHSRKPVPAGEAQDIVSGEPSTYAGYAVDASLAFDILDLHYPRPEKKAEWGSVAAQCGAINALLVFRKEICKTVNGLPSITLPPRQNEKGLMRVEDFLKHFIYHPGLGSSVYVYDMLGAFSQGEWEKIAQDRISRPFLRILCAVVARAAERRIEEGEKIYNTGEDSAPKGIEFFNEVWRIAAEQGIEMDRAKINRPLCFAKTGWQINVPLQSAASSRA